MLHVVYRYAYAAMTHTATAAATEGYSILQIVLAQQALQVLNCIPIDIMLTDLEMPRGNGLELLEKVLQEYKSVDTLVISGYAHFSYAQKAMEFVQDNVKAETKKASEDKKED